VGAYLWEGAWGDTFAGHDCAITSQASRGVDLVKRLLGPTDPLVALEGGFNDSTVSD
jgi:hypothetical protein